MDVGPDDDFPPVSRILCKERRELRGGPTTGYLREVQNLLSEIGTGSDLLHRGSEPGDYIEGRSGRRKQPIPGIQRRTEASLL